MRITFSLFLLIASFLFLELEFYAQGVAINETGAKADSSAMLDVSSDSQGILIPRIALTSVNDTITVPSPAVSLLVYNTGTGGFLPAGFYYWDGIQWVSAIGGNSGTVFCATQIFNDSVPFGFTDLDLSPVIGITQKIVLLRIYDASGQTSFYCRPNNDNGNYDAVDPNVDGTGVQATRCSSSLNASQLVLCKTDILGVIEIKSSQAVSLKIDVLSFW
ncbi:hypothetical protein KKA39_00470 [Patescibacteria group bacterium]|nr:hypothetical protein [Patescibacteria group bacterium]